VIGHYIAYGILIVLRHSGVAARREQAAVGERAELLRFGAGAAEVRTDAPPSRRAWRQDRLARRVAR